MKMRLFARRSLLLCLTASIMLVSCKKKKAFKDEDGQVTVDNRMTQGENDEAIKDINIVILEQSFLRGKSASPQTILTGTTSICGINLDTTGIAKDPAGPGGVIMQQPGGTIVLNYTGTECYGRIRSGSIKVAIVDYPVKKWKNTGCVLRIDYTAYKVTRTSDGKSIQFDGTQYLTNVSGGSWFDLWFLNQPSVTYDLTGENLKITFDGGQSAIYNFNRRMNFTYSGNYVTCSVQGLGSSDGRSNLQNWGETRKNTLFTSQITDPLIWKTECGAMAPLAGEIIVREDGKDFDLKCKMGTDKTGEPLGLNAGECPFGYELSWSYKKRTNTRVFGYY
jgi:hypothetical protein